MRMGCDWEGGRESGIAAQVFALHLGRDCKCPGLRCSDAAVCGCVGSECRCRWWLGLCHCGAHRLFGASRPDISSSGCVVAAVRPLCCDAFSGVRAGCGHPLAGVRPIGLAPMGWNRDNHSHGSGCDLRGDGQVGIHQVVSECWNACTTLILRSLRIWL